MIERMGRKDEARRLAVAAGVPVVPARRGRRAADDARLAERAAAEVGFPLLVKAAAGGGGKGMRIVRAPGRARRRDRRRPARGARRRSATTRCSSSATSRTRATSRSRSSPTPTAPSSTSSSATARPSAATRRSSRRRPRRRSPTAVRETLTGSAVRLAREVGYVNAGTVEFMRLRRGRLPARDEHAPAGRAPGHRAGLRASTSSRCSCGSPRASALPFAQDDVRAAGHAIEARVYAEDPAPGFLPQAGRATFVRWSPRARVDAALEAGQEVGTWYDPMLGKVIAHGADARGRPPRARRRARRHRDLRDHDEPRVPPRPRRLRRLPRRGHRHRLARPHARRRPGARARRSRCARPRGRRPRRRPRSPTTRSRPATAGASAGRPRAVEVALESGGERRVLRVDRAAGVVEDGERRFAVAPHRGAGARGAPPRDRRRRCTSSSSSARRTP